MERKGDEQERNEVEAGNGVARNDEVEEEGCRNAQQREAEHSIAVLA